MQLRDLSSRQLCRFDTSVHSLSLSDIWKMEITLKNIDNQVPSAVIVREISKQPIHEYCCSDGSDKTRDQKAYVQQLENSRMKLTQLEQELQRARQQVALAFARVCTVVGGFHNPASKLNLRTVIPMRVTAMWKTPAERCFLWLGDSRTSDSSRAEDALSQEWRHAGNLWLRLLLDLLGPSSS
nr:transcription factor TGA2.3-like [Ipomoea batatas]